MKKRKPNNRSKNKEGREGRRKEHRSELEQATKFLKANGGQGDVKKAVELLESVARCKDPDSAKYAILMLGCMYLNGRGVRRNKLKAKYWFRRGARRDDSSCQCHLGFMYKNGIGVKPNHFIAYHWFEKAANNGLCIAQEELGDQYAIGLGVAQNWKSAVVWYKRAAKQGMPSAREKLAQCYLHGNGVRRNRRHAETLLSRTKGSGAAPQSLSPEHKDP